MNVTDLLAMHEQRLAFEIIMKGKLNNELEACKQALEDLRNGRDIIAMEEFNAREKQRLDEFRLNMEEQFKAEQDALLKREHLVAEKEEQVAKHREEVLQKERLILRSEKSKQHDFDLALEEFNRQKTQLAQEKASADRLRAELLAKELDLDRKMSAIRAFA